MDYSGKVLGAKRFVMNLGRLYKEAEAFEKSVCRVAGGEDSGEVWGADMTTQMFYQGV